MTTSDHTIKQMLNQSGLRCTPGRVEIYRLLHDADHPIREKDIQDNIDVNIDRTTIYRTLEHFVDVGLVHRAFVKDRAWHYELAHHCRDNQCHPHFICQDCGKTDCLKDTFIPAVTNIPGGYVVERQQLRLEGFCPECSHSKLQKKMYEEC